MRFSNVHLFAICVAIWGSTWFAITFQLGAVAPEMSVGYRFMFAGMVLFAFCRWRGLSLRFSPRAHLDLFAFGTSMFCVSYILVYYAESCVTSGMVAVGYSASPLIAMLLSRLFFNTPMTLTVTLGALLGIIGIGFVFWSELLQWDTNPKIAWGATLTMLSVLASSVGSMVAVRIQRRGYATWTSMAWGMFYGGVLALMIGVLAGQSFTFAWTPAYLGSLVYLAVFGSIIAFASFLTLMERIGAAPASYVSVIVPALALLISFWLEGLKWHWTITLGIVLLLLGNYFIMGEKRETKAA